MDTKGFFGSLLDFSFDNLITVTIVRFLYGLLLVAVGVYALFGIVSAFAAMSQSFWVGLGLLLLVPIGALIGAIVARIYMELLIVIFRIAQHTATIAAAAGGTGEMPRTQ